MKTTTLIGALLGGAVLGACGLAAAATKKKPGDGEDPFFVYVVQPGDTLGELALKFFGDAQRATVLFSAIEKLPDNPEQMSVGAKIRVPCVWETVKPGDTLAAIAQRALGNGKLWRRILEANRNASRQALQDPDKLAVGQRLAVPKEGPVQGPPVAPRAPAAVAVGALHLLGAECAW